MCPKRIGHWVEPYLWFASDKDPLPFTELHDETGLLRDFTGPVWKESGLTVDSMKMGHKGERKEGKREVSPSLDVTLDYRLHEYREGTKGLRER